MTTEQRVIRKLNAELGNKVENLSKTRKLVDQYKNQLENLQEKLTIESEGGSVIIKKALESSENTLNEVALTLDNIEEYRKKIFKQITLYHNVHRGVKENAEKVQELEGTIKYFLVLQDIQDINSEIASCMNKIHGRDDQKIVSLYLSLSGDPTSTTSIIGRLQETNAQNLKLYARNVALHWHGIVIEKMSKDFEAILRNIKWPNLGHLKESFNPTKDALNKLSTFAEYLFLVQLPGYERFMYVKLTPSIILPPITTPIELLVKPFKQRFEYHFMGNRQTNRLDKPEWYFTQILNWAKDNHLFVGEVFQSAANRACVSDNIRLEFIRGLVQLAIEKLVLDIEEISLDEGLFAHLIDEVLAFEQDLKTYLNYPINLPSTILVLTQIMYFDKWLAIEEKFTTDKMDQILHDENHPWDLLDPFGFSCITSTAATINPEDQVELDDLRIPKCADQFVRLLDAMKERYCCLPQPTHQLKFLDLQISLVDNFRRRLVQLYNHGIGTTHILNAIFYINLVLREWGENVHYLHLHAALIGPNAEEINSVFDKSVAELEHWQKRLIKELASKVFDEIKARSMSYRHDNWVSMPLQTPNEPFILSYSAAELFQILITNLHDLECSLSTKLFNEILRKIAYSLDDFFIDSMIMNTKFSIGGSAQFKFDITRNLLPLFGQYARKPGLLFKNLSDACVLLNLPFGSAMLLYDTLKSITKTTNPEEHKRLRDALKEVGVNNLPTNLAFDILERRTDICL